MRGAARTAAGVGPASGLLAHRRQAAAVRRHLLMGQLRGNPPGEGFGEPGTASGFQSFVWPFGHSREPYTSTSHFVKGDFHVPPAPEGIVQPGPLPPTYPQSVPR